MSDLIERLRAKAKSLCERHNRFDPFDPRWERKPKDFLEWEAADEIKRLETSLLISQKKHELAIERIEKLEKDDE
jgi:hypothetical protein